MGQEFDLLSSQVDVHVAAGFDHVPVKVGFQPGLSAGELSALSVQSDQVFVTPTIDAEKGVLCLEFETSGLIASRITGTVTVSNASHTEQLFVTAHLSALDIVELLDDPRRPLTYGLHDPVGGTGGLTWFDPISGENLACLGLGARPSDLVLSSDGDEMLVICPGEKEVWVVDMIERVVKEIISLPEFGVHSSSPSSSYRTTSNVEYGPGDTFYYTDESLGSGPATRR